MNIVPRGVIQGMQILRYFEGPYVEVAERIRLLYKMEKALCIRRTQTLLIRDRWIYRVTLALDEQQYIGDAEIHFGSPKETPDGTNPVSCGQTSAVGNALTFAGFGDLRLLLERQNLNAEEARAAFPTEPPYGEIEGVRVVWLNETPYVPVAERLYHLYHLGHTLSMEDCEVIRINGSWVYRVSMSVDGHRYIADAEVHFSAPETTPERRYPVSTAQTSAVGNALALAGFGDVRTLLNRMGKDAARELGIPSLASAEAVAQANHQRQPTVLLESGREDAPLSLQADASPLITTTQRQTIQELSSRLGGPAPEAMDDWTFADAETYIEVLRMQLDDLLETADEAHTPDKGFSVSPEHSKEEDIANYTEVGDLKRAWMNVFGIHGTTSAIRQQWETFKRTHCQEPVNDDIMLKSQYRVIKDAIERRRSDKEEQREHVNGHDARK